MTSPRLCSAAAAGVHCLVLVSPPSPQSSGGCTPGGGGGAYGFVVANSWPRNPLGVQAIRPIGPGGRRPPASTDLALVPPGRTVVNFRFVDLPAKTRDWWLVLTSEGVDICDFGPGYDVAVSVTGTLRRMVEIWRGDLGWPAALRSGVVQLQGPERFRRGVPQCSRRRTSPEQLALRLI